MMRIYVIIKTAWSSGMSQPGPLGRLKMNIYSRYKNCKKSGCCICQTETATARDLSGRHKRLAGNRFILHERMVYR